MNLKQAYFMHMGDQVGYFHNTIDLNKETIIMLHPAFADHHIFVKQVEKFYENYNLLLLDMPGHGLSNGVKKCHMGHTPEIIEKILQDLDIKKVHLLGVSVGSLVAQGFADLYPEMVSSLIVVGGYSIHDDNADVLKSQRKEMFKWLFLIIFNMKKFRKYIVDVSVVSDLGREKMTLGVDQFTRGGFRSMSGMNSIFRQTDEEKTYPLLAIVGEHDLPLAHESARKLGQKSNGRSIQIDDAGHCANIDNHESFNRVMMDFISDK